MSVPYLFLKKREERRLLSGHVWVFGNEVDGDRLDWTTLEPGSWVEVRAAQGRFLGMGYVNPRSLISVRLLSFVPGQLPDQDWFVAQITRALHLREQIYASPHYRLIFGESDGLPGLVVDRYGDVLVVQVTTAGMERMLEDILAALVQVLTPQGILLRNDSSVRELEGLPSYVRVGYGHIPETVEILEGGLRFLTRPQQGQKTGWFYDQRDNRDRFLRYVRGKRVLDLFSYVGAWGIRAAAAGADRVVCVDSSEQALRDVQTHAEMNQVALETIKADVFDALQQMIATGQTFDVVVADPPAFIKRRKDHAEGTKAYERLHHLSLQVLEEEGILVSASCSHHLAQEELHQILRRTAQQRGKWLQILESGGQGPDHPIHPAIPETSYLKAYISRVGTTRLRR